LLSYEERKAVDVIAQGMINQIFRFFDFDSSHDPLCFVKLQGKNQVIRQPGIFRVLIVRHRCSCVHRKGKKQT